MFVGDVDEELGRLQRRQFGAFSRTQALDLGLSRGMVDGRVRRGRYRVLQPGVHCERGVPDGWELRAMAAVLWAGGDAVLARSSAARLHGLEAPPADAERLHLLVGDRSFVARAGLRVHRTRHLLAHHTTTVGPLPATTVTRTVCDLAQLLRPVDLRDLVAAAARDGRADAPRLRACLAELGPVAGAARLRSVVDELSPLAARCRSPLESDWLALVRRHGLEPTAMNQSVRDAVGCRRVIDALYLPARLPVELDGAWSHSTTLDRADDLARERALALTGELRPPLRFTWADVHDRPNDVVHRLRAALADTATTSPARS